MTLSGQPFPAAVEFARLADLREFSMLREYFDSRRDLDIAKLGRQAFAKPEEHDALEAHKLKAFYAGVDAVLSLPVKARDEIKRQEGNT